MKIPFPRGYNFDNIFFSNFYFWDSSNTEEKNAGGKDKDALGWALKVRQGAALIQIWASLQCL